jgi:hypothetical protein
MSAETSAVEEPLADRPLPVPTSWLLPLAFAVVALLLLISRLPLVYLTNFWAEDGRVFYADAYNLGWLRASTEPVPVRRRPSRSSPRRPGR